MKKKIFVLLTIVLFVLGLVGCGSNDIDSNTQIDQDNRFVKIHQQQNDISSFCIYKDVETGVNYLVWKWVVFRWNYSIIR